MCGRRMTLMLALLSLVLVAGAAAKDTDAPETVSDLGLPTLSGEVRVYYSEGYAERAAHLQKMVEEAHRFFAKAEVLGIDLDLGLAVLGPEDWSRWTRMPYGMAHIELGDSPAAILPATKDNVLVNSALESRGRVSEETLLRLEGLGLSYEDAAALMFMDLIAFHEIGHIYSNAFDVWPTEKWLSELTATYVAYAFFESSRPKLARIWDAMTDSMVETNEHEHTTLADFEELYVRVGGSNYGWYQVRFNQRVRDVYAKSGIAFMHHLQRSLAENPEAAEGDPFRLQELERFSEGFVAWAEGPEGDLERAAIGDSPLAGSPRR